MKDDDVIGVEVLQDLDPDSPVSRYRQIADQLAAAVLDRRPGARLPSEYEILNRLGVSRATATQALRDLEQRGLVTRRQGKGTFVADPDRAIRSNRPGVLPSFSEDLRAAGRTTRERVIALEIASAPADVAAALGIGKGDDVWSLERIIVSDDQPVVHLTSWLSCATVPALSRSAVEATSLYEQLSQIEGSRPCSADEQWSAAVAPPTTATVLDVGRNAPVMRVVRTAYLHDERPVEYAIAYVRGETFAVSIHIDAHQHRSRLLASLTKAAG
ncbi:GntR family transcriptional regulator [Xylanimonas oleitrophica]|nr:GntR family transcriptional regulator [Xylanimonas oleitrophica]